MLTYSQGCIFCLTCSYPELTEDHVLTSAYVKFFRTVTRNAVNKSVWRKKDCFWLPLNKHAVNIWLSSLRIRAHLSWRTGKHLHVLHVLRTYPTCSYPGYQDTTTYAALEKSFRFCESRWSSIFWGGKCIDWGGVQNFERGVWKFVIIFGQVGHFKIMVNSFLILMRKWKLLHKDHFQICVSQ